MKSIRENIPFKIGLLVFAGVALVSALAGGGVLYWIFKGLDRDLAGRLQYAVAQERYGNPAGGRLADPYSMSAWIGEQVLGARLIDRESAWDLERERSLTPIVSNYGKILLGYDQPCRLSLITALVPPESGALPGRVVFIELDGKQNNHLRRSYLILFGCGVLGVALAAACMAAVAAYRTVVPCANELSRITERVTHGEFSARLPECRNPDELGLCFNQVNSLVATLEGYIAKLQELNRTKEAIANALNRDEVIRVVAEVIERQFSVQCLGIFASLDLRKQGTTAQQYAAWLDPNEFKAVMGGKVGFASNMPGHEGGRAGAGHPSQLIFVPVVEDNDVTTVILFASQDRKIDLDPVTREFARALSRIMSSAFSRIKSLHEITQAESKYRALFMTAEGGIFRAAASGMFEDVNPALAKMIGYESVEDMQEVVSDIAQLLANPGDQDKIFRNLTGSDRIRDFGLMLIRRDGVIFPASLSGHTVRNSYGELVAVEGFIVDLTERTLREQAERDRAAAEAASQVKSAMLAELENKNRQLQESLEEIRFMQRQLLRAEKASAIGTMSAGLAHELSNFLAGSVSYPELLLMQLPPESEMRKPLEQILAAGRQAVSLVNDLLTLSSGTEGAWQIRELNHLIEQVLQSLEIRRVQTINPDLVVEARLCSETTSIRCSPVPLARAVSNLLMCCLRNGGPAGRIALETEIRDIGAVETDSYGLQAGPHVVVRFSDSGPLLGPDQQEHLFEPFYARKVFGADPENSGLGLTLVWNVVQEHGGTVTVSTEAGKNVYHLYLPISDQDALSDMAEEPFGADLIGNGTVLVVDDEPLQRDIAGKMLAQMGYKVYLVASGNAAVEFVRHQPVDLILLDMLMPPGINGRETYERIVRLNPEQKTLLVTGYSKSSEIQKTLELGAIGPLKKPYTFSQFGQAVRKAFDS